MAKKVVDKENTIKTLSTVEHILLRPNLYLGSTSYQEYDAWIIEDDDKIVYKKVKYTEALLKILNEVIDNSTDEYVRTNGKYSTKIDIQLTKDTCIITDNGRGIPTTKNTDGVSQAFAACCIPMSGSNFENDEERETAGVNGIGLKGTSIYSTYFECVTCDKDGKLKIIAENNLSKTKVTELTKTPKTGTKITFKPDFKRFSVKEFDEYIFSLTKTRLKFLAWFYPNCNFTFNGEKITFKVKDFSNMLSEDAVVLNTDNVYCCVYPSDEPNVLTYVNGLNIKKGGSHIDYITNKIVNDIRDKVSKKYKSIKPADIKNRLSLVVFFNKFANMKFDSQTKEQITNSQSEITEYLKKNEIDLDTFTTKIIKNKEIIDNITEMFRLKEELAEKKDLAKLNKTKKEVESEKYFPPTGKSAKKCLFITEGFSAGSAMIPILGRTGHGFYFLKGKPLNIYGMKPINFMKNQEVRELIQILGIDLSDENTDMTYEKVVVLSDADPDGVAIAGLILNLFSRIAPRMIKEERICRLETPLLLGLKNNKVEDYHFTMPKLSDMKKSLDYHYLKGLGSWEKTWFNQVVEKEGGLEKLFMTFEFDEHTQESLDKWFGKDSEPRKDKLRGREFHIDRM